MAAWQGELRLFSPVTPGRRTPRWKSSVVPAAGTGPGCWCSQPTCPFGPTRVFLRRWPDRHEWARPLLGKPLAENREPAVVPYVLDGERAPTKRSPNNQAVMWPGLITVL